MDNLFESNKLWNFEKSNRCKYGERAGTVHFAPVQCFFDALESLCIRVQKYCRQVVDFLLVFEVQNLLFFLFIQTYHITKQKQRTK